MASIECALQRNPPAIALFESTSEQDDNSLEDDDDELLELLVAVAALTSAPPDKAIAASIISWTGILKTNAAVSTESQVSIKLPVSA